MIEVNLQVIFGEYDCVAHTSIKMPEDYTMNQLVQAVRDRDYKKFRIVETMKRFVAV